MSHSLNLMNKNDKSLHVAQLKHILNFPYDFRKLCLTLDKLTSHDSLITLLFCSPKSPAYDCGGTELDIVDTQGTLEGGRLE